MNLDRERIKQQAKREETDPATRLCLLRRHILADAALQDRLVAMDDTMAFVHAACAVAAGVGLAIDPDEVSMALYSDPLGVGGLDAAGFDGIEWPARAWLPGSVVPTADGAAVEWIHFGGAALDEPFFADSVRRAKRRPFNRLLRYRTPLAMLAAHAPAGEGKLPDGLIFHMSRCGSTLVAQMLAAARSMVVLSEAPPLDDVVRYVQSRPDLPLAIQLALVRAMVSALARRADGTARCILKLDSWHTLALPLFRRAFPDTPWLFLYRDPVEVIVSHLRMGGWQMVPGVDGGRYDILDGLTMPREAYIARVLARICEAVVAHVDERGLLVRYENVPDRVTDAIVRHFKLAIDAEERAAMVGRALHDSKTPMMAFAPDGAAKRRAASDAVRAAAETHVAPVVAVLDAMRRSGSHARQEDRRQGGAG